MTAYSQTIHLSELLVSQRDQRIDAHWRLGYKLSEAFGIIPSLRKKAAPVKPQDDWAGIDPETLARAKVLGMVAMERAALPPPEADQLEAQVQKTKVQSERKPRLFDDPD